MFSSCITLPKHEEKDPLIVDLKEIIQDRVWKIWFSSLSPFQKRFLKRKNFEIEVPENFFVFEHIRNFETNGTVRETSGSKENTDGAKESSADAGDGGNVSDQRVAEVEGARGQVGLTLPHSNDGFNRSDSESVSLKTTFDNSTGEKQLYHFKFNKQRRTSITVSFQKGFTFGAKTNFSVGLGQILGGAKLGANAELNYNVTKTEGQTFEDIVQMEATSDIAVGENSCYTANVQLDEVRVHKRFTSISRMMLPQEHASIYINRKRNGRCVFVYDLNTLWDVFGGGVVPCARAVPDKDGEPREDQVDFMVEGVVSGSLSCNHQILLNSDKSPQSGNSKSSKNKEVDGGHS